LLKHAQLQTILSLLITLFLLFLAACTAAPPTLSVSEAWTRPTAEGNNAAVYFIIKNGTPADLIILSASSSIARAVEIHRSMIMSSDELDGMIEDGNDTTAYEVLRQDVMQMIPLDAVGLPSGSSLNFEPGDLHIMLVDLENELKLGDNFFVTLSFDNSQDVQIEVQVDER